MTDIYKAPEADLQSTPKSGDQGSLEGALAGNFEIKPIEIFKQSWATLEGLKTPFWLGALIVIAISIAFELIANLILGLEFGSEEFGLRELIKQILSTFLIMPLGIGLYMIALRHSLGKSSKASHVFNYYDKAPALFLTSFLYYVLVALGLVLLIIPGIYLIVAFSFSYFLIVDKNMTPIEALKTSQKVVHKKWFNMAGFILLAMIITVIAAMALLIGLIWALPMVTLAYGILYRDIFGVEEQTLRD